MSPRRSAAAARATRDAIVERAVEMSSTEGLEGLSFGRLAAELEMSKAGVLGHFPSKQALQETALEAAIDLFSREVLDRAADADPGLPRLCAICDAWISYLERGVFPGGCFLTAAAAELDGRPGPLRDAVAVTLRRWHDLLESHAALAVAAGDLPPGTDPADVAFQLNALAMAANQALQLLDDREALRRAHRAMRAALGSPA